MNPKEQYPSKLLEDAVEAIGSLPGVGKRSALRLALHLLRQPAESVHHFADAIVHLRDDVKYCKECWMISDDDVCSICCDKSRDHNEICVVENVRDVMSIENTERLVKSSASESVEVIMALRGDVEGETTAFYIYRQIEKFGVRVSSLARGLGFGDDLEYADALTLGRSITGRQPFKPE